MINYTIDQFKEVMAYSKIIIEKAQKKERNVFDFARKAGEKYFYKVDKLLVNDYIYAIDNVEYKLKELEYLGKVAGNDTAVYKELINVIEEKFGEMLKEMVEIVQLNDRINKLRTKKD